MGNLPVNMPADALIKNCKLMLSSSDMDTSGSTAASGDFYGESGSKNWLLGDSFLQNYYSVFDLEKKAIGLAPAK